MTRRQIRTALMIVDDVHRIERCKEPGAATVVQAPLHLVQSVLIKRMQKTVRLYEMFRTDGKAV